MEKLLEDPESMSKLTTSIMMQLFGKEESRYGSEIDLVSTRAEIVRSSAATNVGLVDVKIGYKVDYVVLQP